jgi:hypothetical protein
MGGEGVVHDTLGHGRGDCAEFGVYLEEETNIHNVCVCKKGGRGRDWGCGECGCRDVVADGINP